MIKQPIAIQVYSVRDLAVEDFRGTMQAIKDMGYDGVELAGTYDLTVPEVKKILDDIGLEMPSAHVKVPLLEQDEVLDDFAATGLKYIAVPHISGLDDEPSVMATIERIRDIAIRCRERGMKLLYHNHFVEFEKINDK